MPRIPQYTAQQSILTGSTGPHADAPAFGAAGLGEVGQGLANLGDSLGDIAHQRKQIEQKKKFDDEQKWVSDAAHQYTLESAEFNQKNKHREDYSTALLDHMKARRGECLKLSPSTRASTRLKAILDNQIESRYQTALAITERTKLEAAALGIQQNVADLSAAFRADASTSAEYATQQYEPLRQQLLESIDSRYAELAPNIAATLKEQVDADSILMTADAAPWYAREILDGSRNLSEQKRATLLRHIEGAEQEGHAVLQWSVKETLESNLEAARRGEGVKRLDKATIRAAYGDERGEVVAADYAAKMERLRRGNSIIAEFRDKNTAYYGKLPERLAGERDDVRQHVGEALRNLGRQQTDDPQQFLRNNNEEVQTAYNLLQSAPDDMKPAYLRRAHQIALQYQGYPPTDATPEEAARYLNLPERARHIMTEAEAKQLGTRLAKGSVSDQLGVINEMLAQYDRQTQFVAFSDLVHYAEIPPALQLAYLNQGKTWLNEYINVALKPEVLEKLTPQKQGEFEERLNKNAQWHLFTRSMYGDAQRIREVGAWKHGIIAYANALAFKGEKLEDATDKAFQRLITDNLAFPVVHGEPVTISRTRPDGTVRQDHEIQDMGRRLTLALRDIPPQHIKTADENGNPYFPTLLPDSDPLKHQYIRDLITSKGFFRPTADGQSVSVYLLEDDGMEFQLLDKNNKPLEVDLEVLPTWRTSRYSLFGTGGNFGLGGQEAVIEKPSTTYKGEVKDWAPYWRHQRPPVQPEPKPTPRPASVVPTMLLQP